MKNLRSVPVLLLALLLMLPGNGSTDTKPPVAPRVMEAFPGYLQARLEAAERSRRALPPTIGGHALEFVVSTLRTWDPGQTVHVAFLGGDAQLRADIAKAVEDWTSKANINLDFGFDPATKRYREWTRSDSTYAAEVRVGFGENGYWSLVGRDSSDPSIVLAKQASLNLQGFDRQRPTDWRAVVLHEFGHALGFEHEHQHPTQGCNADFRWDDDPGYVPTTDGFGQYVIDSNGRRPGIYTVLGGPPNEWPQAVVDFNLKQLPSADSHAYAVGPFDRTSIMKYVFPAWMFTQGDESHCFSNGENTQLSAGDVAGIQKGYGLRGVETASTDTRVQMLTALSNLQGVSEKDRAQYRQRSEALRKHP